MNLSSIFGSVTNAAIDSTPLGSLLDISTKLIDRFIPDPAAAAAAKLKLLELQQSGELVKLSQETGLQQAQAKIDLAEAKSKSLFVSGWRPALGWVCVIAFAWNYFGISVLTDIANLTIAFLNLKIQLPILSSVDMTTMLPVLMGMLGLGAMHTNENLKGVTHL